MLTSFQITKLAKDIFEEILKLTQDKINLNEYCAKKLKSVYSKLSELEIAEELDRIVAKVTFYMDKEKERCKSLGITPAYEFNDYPPNVLFRYSIKHKEPLLLSSLRKQKRVLLRTINQMSWQSFEYLCKHLLEISGVKPLELTNVNQEGIDFCGLTKIGCDTCSGIIPKNFKIRIVGQVRHFSKKISPSSVRTFNTYCKDVKNKNEDILRKLPNWFTKTETPVLGIFITTSSFTKGVNKYTKKEWIILRNGEQVVEDLINKSPYNKDWLKNRGGELTFDQKYFLEFFKNKL
jgi:hypothetical protein